MTDEEAAIGVIDGLTSLAIPYMVVGSFSTTYYSIPRLTKDADLVIDLGDQSLRSLLRVLGPAFRLDPQMSFETITATTRNEISVVESAFTIELFHLSKDEHDQERFRRRTQVRMLGREVWLPTVEDVLITKLRWARPKDREDIRAVIAIQNDRIDWDYVHSWTDRHETTSLLHEIQASIPDLGPE
jgi:hypothetical protein